MQNQFKGRGTYKTPGNRFQKSHIEVVHPEGIDEQVFEEAPTTEVIYDHPGKIVNKVDSPDVGMMYSANPYQGCEHGCAYCYARNTHEFWGFNAGLDFERRIVAKPNAPKLLKDHLLKPNWTPQAIVLSGNTDCYQPLEKQLKLTRQMLEVFARYRHPVGIITKNVTLLRDLDILKDLANDGLVRVYFSITTMDESLRRTLEPRTATAKRKLDAIRILSENRIPVGIMNAPLIPGLNHHETPAIIRAAAEAGALSAGYTVVRLNGHIREIFHQWLADHYPDRAKKVWNQVSHLHGGKVNDSEWGVRIKGQGVHAEAISQLFKSSVSTYMSDRSMPPFNTSVFRRGGNYNLF